MNKHKHTTKTHKHPLAIQTNNTTKQHQPQTNLKQIVKHKQQPQTIKHINYSSKSKCQTQIPTNKQTQKQNIRQQSKQTSIQELNQNKHFKT